jgi:hypothetical protein
MSTAFRHDPAFVLRNGRRMLAHTFRGSTWRSMVGLESAREVFHRYRAIRGRERDYLDWPDPLSACSAKEAAHSGSALYSAVNAPRASTTF